MRKLGITSESITSKRTESIKKYLYDLSQIEVLTPDEEYELSYLAFEENNEEARQKLIKHNLRFVVSVAKQYDNKDVNLEDLINEGNLGLIIASYKFDPSRGFKFISYAVWWIRRNIKAYIIENSKIIRFPSNKSNINYKINRKCNELEQILQREPSYNDIINAYGELFSEEEIAFYFYTLDTKTASLDKQLGEGSSDTVVDLIEDDKVLKPTHFVNQLDIDYERETILNSLDNNLERDVIKLVFGLDGKEPTSLKDAGFLLGVSGERVRQIREIALKKLKNKLRKNS